MNVYPIRELFLIILHNNLYVKVWKFHIKPVDKIYFTYKNVSLAWLTMKRCFTSKCIWIHFILNTGEITTERSYDQKKSLVISGRKIKFFRTEFARNNFFLISSRPPVNTKTPENGLRGKNAESGKPGWGRGRGSRVFRGIASKLISENSSVIREDAAGKPGTGQGWKACDVQNFPAI